MPEVSESYFYSDLLVLTLQIVIAEPKVIVIETIVLPWAQSQDLLIHLPCTEGKSEFILKDSWLIQESKISIVL